MSNIPKLYNKVYNGKLYVVCPKCSYWANRYDSKDNKDGVGTTCPDCRLKQRLKEREKK